MGAFEKLSIRFWHYLEMLGIEMIIVVVGFLIGKFNFMVPQ